MARRLDHLPTPVKRRELPLPDLVRLLEHEKRIHTRFNKVFVVVIGSELYGDTYAIARNVSAGGVLVEMTYAPPLGTVVTVHFKAPGGDDFDEMVVRAEVKHHHYLNFSGSGEAAATRAIGLRFLDFVDAGERVDPARLH